MTLVPGQMLSHYRLLEKIGEGGMGIVWKAEDTKLRRHVALKVLPPHLVTDEVRRLRFLREARAAAAVTHPHIAAIHEVGEAAGQVFIAMELVEGRSLREVLRGGLPPIKDGLSYALEIAEALARAHAARVIHRDFKPDNVMIDADGHVRVLDFGLAKLLHDDARGDVSPSRQPTITEEMTRQGHVLGTPAYMSPEQALGDQVDAGSDLFSFGTMLYEMVTGVCPFRGGTMSAILRAVVRDDPALPTVLNAAVPQDLERIVLKCLEKDRRDRYQHAADLVVDLRRIRRTTDAAAPGTRTPTAPVPVKRRPWPGIGLSALGATLLIALAWLGLGKWTPQALTPLPRGARVLVCDFQNDTGLRVLDATVRDAMILMLSRSTHLDVLAGDRLKKTLARGGHDAASRLKPEQAGRICAAGACEALLLGWITRAESDIEIRVQLQRPGDRRPLAKRLGRAPSEEGILAAIHEVVLGLRQESGELPQVLAADMPPTTTSLIAYQYFSRYSFTEPFEEQRALLLEAIQVDPEFSEAHDALATTYYNKGDAKAYRRSAEAAHRTARGKSALIQRKMELNYLIATQNYEAAVDRLQAARSLNPDDPDAANSLEVLLLDVFGDAEGSLPHSRDSYRLSPHSDIPFRNLLRILIATGRASETDALIKEFEARGGSPQWALLARSIVHAAGHEWEEAMRLIDGQSWDNEYKAGQAATIRSAVFLSTGRFDAAWQECDVTLRRAESTRNPSIFFQTGSAVGWLGFLRRRGPTALPDEALPLLETAIGTLRWSASYFVTVGQERQLARILTALEANLGASESRIVNQILQFGRGSLALIRGRAAEARAILEPLRMTYRVPELHHVLSYTYEALGHWGAAAAELETFVKSPTGPVNLESWGPSIRVWEQLRLARLYERAGDPEQAARWCEEFLKDWRDADEDAPELAEARALQAALRSQSRSAAATGAAQDGD